MHQEPDRLRAVAPGYRILSSNIYVKPPGHGRFEIHQNWPTIEALDVPTLTVWVPLQDTDFGNGTIRVAKGSHHVFPDVAAASSERFFDDYAAQVPFAVSPRSVRWYQALSLLKLSATHMAAARCFEEGRFNDLRMPAMGSQILPTLRQMEKAIEAA